MWLLIMFCLFLKNVKRFTKKLENLKQYKIMIKLNKLLYLCRLLLYAASTSCINYSCDKAVVHSDCTNFS